MTILDMAPYINGDMYTRDCRAPYRYMADDLAPIFNEAGASDVFNGIFDSIDSPEAFEYLIPDVARLIPKNMRDEAFYCLKLGGFVPGVPAKFVYYMKTLTEKYGSVSLALKAVRNSTLEIFMQKDYFDGYTMRDVIKSLVDKDYEPFTASNLKIKHSTYDEIYVAETDMVALLPKDISDALTTEDIAGITVDKSGLAVKGRYLRLMSGHFGACNSTYDLRNVV